MRKRNPNKFLYCNLCNENLRENQFFLWDKGKGFCSLKCLKIHEELEMRLFSLYKNTIISIIIETLIPGI